jgi:hypothetical protein
MKKYLLKTSLFVLPFIFLFILNTFLYNQQEGDLVRLGYLYSNPTPKSFISSQYDLPKRYTLLSEVDLKQKSNFDVITIGDSFSEQDSLGFKNFICHNGVKVLHIDRFIAGSNPMQTLIKLVNSEFFNYVSTDYIVLQSVERQFNSRASEIDFDLTIDLDSISNQIESYKKPTPNYAIQFLSNATLKIPISYIQYNFQRKPNYSKTYKYTSISRDLFTNEPDELLFYQEDIDYLKIKNDSANIMQSIEVIERINDLLTKRNMKLIMLVSPDKYDLYFSFIKDNKNLTDPLFFEIYEPAPKSYTNLDSYKILREKIESEKDVYYYDDTHWSPKGAKTIADEIYKIISR